MYLFHDFSRRLPEVLYNKYNFESYQYDIADIRNFDSLKTEFQKVLDKDFLDRPYFSINKPSLPEKKDVFFIEKTFYSINVKTKKVIYLCQMLIEFQGMTNDGESASNKINSIRIMTGSQIKKHDKLILTAKYDFSQFDELPPPIKKLKN
jgi:hypothetical protein